MIGRIGGVEDDVFVDERDAALPSPEAKEFVEAVTIFSYRHRYGLHVQGRAKTDFQCLSYKRGC